MPYSFIFTDEELCDLWSYYRQISQIIRCVEENLNSVKFTWRFTENRRKVAVPESPGIFNDKYNPTFS